METKMVSPLYTITQNTLNNQNLEQKRERVLTDGYFLFIHIVAMCAWGALIFYCAYYGDMRRITAGYDYCRNVCGVDNFFPDSEKLFGCEGSRMIFRPYLLVFVPDGRNSYNSTTTGLHSIDRIVPPTLSNAVTRVCLPNCRIYPDYEIYRNKCVQKKRKEVSDRFFSRSGFFDLFEEVTEDIDLMWKYILFIEIGAFALSFLFTIAYFWLTLLTIWLLLFLTIFIVFAFGSYMCILWTETNFTLDQTGFLLSKLEIEKSISYLTFAVTSFSIALRLCLCTFNKRKKLRLIVQLQKDVLKSIKAVHLLILQNMLTGFLLLGTIVLSVYLSLWVESSGFVTVVEKILYIYKKDPLMLTARWYNIFTVFWTLRFLLSLQYMIISGAVSYYYFSKDKNNLKIPILYTFYNLGRYHLGSVSKGSLLELLLPVIRLTFVVVSKCFKIRKVISGYKLCAMKYFTKSIYVEIAIYGYTYLEAEKHVCRVRAANNFQNNKNPEVFVLHYINIFIVVIAMFVSVVMFQRDEGILHLWILLVLIGYFAYVISNCFTSLHQSIIDIIFACYLEDCYYHDGLSKPHHASMEFLELIKNYKSLFITSTTSEDGSM